MDFEQLKEALRSWGAARGGIIAIGVVGSYARGTPSPDSDVDLIVVTENPETLHSQTSWIDIFGSVQSVVREDYGLVRSLRCIYDDGMEVEFGITSAVWCTPPIDPETAFVISSGLLIIHDPDGVLGRARAWIELENENVMRRLSEPEGRIRR